MPLNLTHVVEPGYIWISSRDLIRQESHWEPESRFADYDTENQLNQSVELSYQDAHITDILNILSETYSVCFDTDYGAIQSGPKKIQPKKGEGLAIIESELNSPSDLDDLPLEDINLYFRIKDKSLHEGIEQALKSAGLSFIPKDNYIWISTPEYIVQERKKNKFGLAETSEALNKKLTKVVSLQGEMNLNVFIKHTLVEDQKLTVILDHRPFVDVPPQEDTQADEDEQLVDTPTPKAFTYFPQKTITDGRIGNVYLQKIQLRDALRAILRPLGLTYQVMDSFIWISTPESIQSDLNKEDPNTNKQFIDQLKEQENLLKVSAEQPQTENVDGIHRKLEKVVSLVFDYIYLEDLLDILAPKYELTFVVDQLVVLPKNYTGELYAQHYGPAHSKLICEPCKPESDGMIRRIQLEDTARYEVYSIVARQLGLDWVIDNEKIIFSTPQRIERHAFTENDLIPVNVLADELHTITK